MASIRFNVKGLAEELRHVAALATASRLTRLFATKLYTQGERIMLRSKMLVPVVTGNLRASGHVKLPVIAGTRAMVELGYGGPAARYALAVHENPRAGKTGGVSPAKGFIQGGRYKRYATSGQWKYLEQPFLEMQADVTNEIGAQVLGEILKMRG